MSSSRFSLGVSHGGGNRHVPDYGGEVAFDLVVGQTILENLVLLLPPILPMSCLAWATSHSSHFSFSSVNFVNGGMPLAFVPPPQEPLGPLSNLSSEPFLLVSKPSHSNCWHEMWIGIIVYGHV